MRLASVVSGTLACRTDVTVIIEPISTDWIDIRPIRKDGRRVACTIYDSQYDQAATAKLIEIFYRSGAIKSVLFNDSHIRRVRHWPGHDNHLHISLHG